MKRTPFRAKVGARYGRRHTPGEMNKTEERYAGVLQLQKHAGEIIDWHFECHRFKLAADLVYTPDFGVLHVDGSYELIDVKGSGPIDAKSIVKIKAAAEKFHWFRWTMVMEQKKESGGGTKRREF